MGRTANELVESIFGDAADGRGFYPDAVVISVGGDAIAYVGVTPRLIEIDGQPVVVAGIGFVCTHPEYRGIGLMSAAMTAAHHRFRRFVAYALLNTGSPELYENLGYTHPPNLPIEWMVCPLQGVTWPDNAVVDLKGTW